MRVKLVILDPDLTSFGGHNFNYLDGMVSEARARGIETRIYGFHEMDPNVRRALGAVGHFKTPGRAMVTDVAGGTQVSVAWTHVVLNEMFGRDLTALKPEMGPDTLVFVPAATSRQTAALAAWLALIAAVSLPKVVCLFRYDLDGYPDEREMLKVPVTVLGTLARPTVFCCETEENAELHRQAFGFPVATMPQPFAIAPAPDTPRRGGKPVVGYFGDARHMKGSHLLPGLCELVSVTNSSYRLCLQTFDTGAEPEVRGQLAGVRKVAVTSPDAIRLILGAQEISRYHRLLHGCDIVLLPHRRQTYRRQTSAIFCEAVSAGKPVVVPDESSMSSALRRYGADPVVFREWTVEGVHAALLRAVADLTRKTQEAKQVAQAWNVDNGAKAMVDFLVRQFQGK
jgi:glycosyltransferase involved in cell wall biosynthesis